MSLKTSLQKGLYLRLEQWTWQTAASSSSLVRIFPPNLRKTSSLCSIAHARWAIGRSDYDFTRAFWNRSKGWELLGVAGPQPTPTRHQLPLTEDEFNPLTGARDCRRDFTGQVILVQPRDSPTSCLLCPWSPVLAFLRQRYVSWQPFWIMQVVWKLCDWFSNTAFESFHLWNTETARYWRRFDDRAFTDKAVKFRGCFLWTTVVRRYVDLLFVRIHCLAVLILTQEPQCRHTYVRVLIVTSHQATRPSGFARKRISTPTTLIRHSIYRLFALGTVMTSLTV